MIRYRKSFDVDNWEREERINAALEVGEVIYDSGAQTLTVIIEAEDLWEAAEKFVAVVGDDTMDFDWDYRPEVVS